MPTSPFPALGYAVGCAKRHVAMTENLRTTANSLNGTAIASEQQKKVRARNRRLYALPTVVWEGGGNQRVIMRNDF